MTSRQPDFRHYLVFVFAGLGALLLDVMISTPHPDLTWHDQQRLGQIAISVLAFAGILLQGIPSVIRVDAVWLWSATGILALGAASAALAMHPNWAATEIALLVVCVGLGVFVYRLMREFGDRADLVMGGFLRLLLAGMVFQFYVTFVAALTHADLYFTPWILLNGFSNMRFQGQFLTIVVPLLGASLLLPAGGGIRYPRSLDMFLMISLAGMVFVAGTRGTIAAWLAVSVIVWWFKEGGRCAAKRMLLVMLAGYALAWLVLNTVTWVTGQEADYRFASDKMLGLSSRGILWEDAWRMIVEHPWLGIGPMHFASLKSLAAHPHQALLQIGSEWGVPVLLLVFGAVSVWLYRVLIEVRGKDAEAGSDLRWALLFAVLGSSVQSMVDGVLVMPYPQLWLAIAVGWCSARCLPRVTASGQAVPVVVPLALLGAAIALLMVVAVKSYPDLVGVAEYCANGPRFWCSGRI